eukprot:457529-Pleurochrysis_carterae.AAC.1
MNHRSCRCRNTRLTKAVEQLAPVASASSSNASVCTHRLQGQKTGKEDQVLWQMKERIMKVAWRARKELHFDDSTTGCKQR